MSVPAPPGVLARLATRVNQRLPELLQPPGPRTLPDGPVEEAMGYALTGQGKRLRPVMTLVAAEIFGGRSAAASRQVLDLACAVEMVHASSLVLDDLPSMDDASLRRGRPTAHRAYGEDMAILAAVALLNRAFAVVAEAGQGLSLKRYSTEDMVHHLAAAIGSGGLIGGQALDLTSAPGDLDLERLEQIHSHKTGALFLAAGELGAMAADARRRDLEVLSSYAKNLGLAYQIADDVLDVTATVEETGKDAAQDEDKVTFVKLLGVDGARSLAEELLGFAMESLRPLGRRAEPLRLLAEFVRGRSR